MKIVDKKSKYRSIRISGDVFFTILTIVVLIGAFVGSLYYRTTLQNKWSPLTVSPLAKKLPFKVK